MNQQTSVVESPAAAPNTQRVSDPSVGLHTPEELASVLVSRPDTYPALVATYGNGFVAEALATLDETEGDPVYDEAWFKNWQKAHHGGFLKRLAEKTLGKVYGTVESLGIQKVAANRPVQEVVSGVLGRGTECTNEEDFANLVTLGYKSVCSLQKPGENKREEELARSNGMGFLRIPILDSTPPTRSQVREFLAYVQEGKNQPVYVHCHGGVGRTGTMVACYRMIVEGKSIEEALEEADAVGRGPAASQDRFLWEIWEDLEAGKPVA